MGLNMVVETAGGRSYSPADYHTLLTQAGFTDLRVHTLDLAGVNTAITAVRPRLDPREHIATVDSALAAVLTQRFELPLGDQDAFRSTLDDLGFDSLSALELAVVANEDLGIPVGEDQITPFMTLGDLLTLLRGDHRVTDRG
jgi:acyl carrier protein